MAITWALMRGGAAAVVLASAAWAQSFVVVPPSLATVEGNSNNVIPVSASTGTYQVLYPASSLTSIPIGARITSMQFRLKNTTSQAQPELDGTATSYDVKIGTSSKTVATLSTTFADNIENGVLVRSGPLTLAAGSYPGGAATGITPEGWGPMITFSRSYVYTGGPLVMEIRNAGALGDDLIASADTSAGGTVSIIASNVALTGIVSDSAVIVRFGLDTSDNLVVPVANETTEGSTSNSIPLGVFANGRHLNLYGADQLSEMPAGSVIVGMQLRQNNAASASWPLANGTISDYEVWLAKSPLTPATISATFAANLTDAVRVRDGALTIFAGAYPGSLAGGSTPEGWGPVISFTTPYLYTGGVLALDIRSTGGMTPTAFADLAGNSATAAGITGGLGADTGGNAGAVVARLLYAAPTTAPNGEGVTKIFAVRQALPGPTAQQSAAFSALALTDQFVFAPSQFQTVGPGTVLKGVSFRNALGSAWPSAPQSENYSIQLSRSLNGPSTLSTSIAGNVGADAVEVRSGLLNVPTGVMEAKPVGTFAAFTFEIPFEKPYVYRSGNLLNVLRFSSFSQAALVDAVALASPLYGTETRGFFGSGEAATSTASQANVPLMRYTADAQVLCPNAVKDGGQILSFTELPLASLPQTMQMLISGTELTYIPVGGLITSLSFVSAGVAAWPNAGGAFASDYRIEISTAAERPGNASEFFAENQGSDVTLVYSGGVTWLPGALPALGSNVGTGATIQFKQPFIYRGGDLCITIRHGGVTSAAAGRVSTGGTISTNRTVYSNSGNTAASGGFLLSNTGIMTRLGYIPSGVSPRNKVLAPGSAGRSAFNPNTAYQMIYDADQVGVPVGAVITGVSMRADQDVNASPGSDLTMSRYDITLSSATRTTATMSTTFADNEGSDVTTVRSGAISIPAGFYPANDAQGTAFGGFIPFTRPFVYKGGPLSMMFRMGSLTAGSNFSWDAAGEGCRGVRNIGAPDASSGTDVFNGFVARFAFTDDAFCFADLNNDGTVEDADFVLFVMSYNVLDCTDPEIPLGCPSDLNHDRRVDDADFVAFLAAYNELICPG
ncbi:MAG: hypothetical protein JSS51_07645 [Planctomycetes bacterium]|nr:hypothetical protein [Planctomycetota bacterium]